MSDPELRWCYASLRQIFCPLNANSQNLSFCLVLYPLRRSQLQPSLFPLCLSSRCELSHQACLWLLRRVQFLKDPTLQKVWTKPPPVASFNTKKPWNSLETVLCEHAAAQSPTSCSSGTTRAIQRCNWRGKTPPFYLAKAERVTCQQIYQETNRSLLLKGAGPRAGGLQVHLQCGERPRNCLNQQLVFTALSDPATCSCAAIDRKNSVFLSSSMAELRFCTKPAFSEKNIMSNGKGQCKLLQKTKVVSQGWAHLQSELESKNPSTTSTSR